ncbi:uncharacterized protein BCR38DRAFT_348622, partial [Pseudomassariella vexata]
GLSRPKVANLDFEARIPVPFSIFPSTYKEAEKVETTTQTHQEVEIKLPEKKAGREGRHSSYSAPLPPREEPRFSEEEVRITREEEHYHRPGVHREHYEERRSPSHYPDSSFTEAHESHVEFDNHHHDHYNAIDKIEREYRSRYQPAYKEQGRVIGTVVGSSVAPSTYSHHSQHSQHSRPTYDEKVRISESKVDTPKALISYHKDTKVIQESVEPPHHNSTHQKSKMGYYDEDGHYHSFRHGLHKLADKVMHHHPPKQEIIEITEVRETRDPSGPPTYVAPLAHTFSAPAAPVPNTVTIPCHHIRMGDILILQGRPCQVIRISTSAATGQHRYLGVDLFTKQLHEESSSVSNPAPSVVVQTMLGPIFKQYRVLDMQDGMVIAMTETGDVKSGLPVIDQSGLWNRLNTAFESGRGSVRVLVLADNGRELVVDMKTVHGSRL